MATLKINKTKDEFFAMYDGKEIPPSEDVLGDFYKTSKTLIALMKYHLRFLIFNHSRPKTVHDFNDYSQKTEPSVFATIWDRRAGLFVIISTSISGMVAITTYGILPPGWDKISKIVIGRIESGLDSYIDAQLRSHFFFKEKFFESFDPSEAYQIRQAIFTVKDEPDRLLTSIKELKGLFIERGALSR